MQIEEYERNYRFEEDYWWYTGRRRIIFDVLRRYCGERSNLQIIDIGCGTGFLTKELEEFGSVCGLDFEDEALAFSKKRGIANLVLADVSNIPFSEDTFDLVCCFDVLEHVNDEKRAIAEMYRVTKKGGYLAVVVPAFKFLWSGEDVVSRHKLRYTKKLLENNLKSLGFKIEKSSYINFILFPFCAAAILVKKCFFKDRLDKSNLSKLPGCINSALSMVFSFESLLLRICPLPYGTSVFCLAKKV